MTNTIPTAAEQCRFQIGHEKHSGSPRQQSSLSLYGGGSWGKGGGGWFCRGEGHMCVRVSARASNRLPLPPSLPPDGVRCFHYINHRSFGEIQAQQRAGGQAGGAHQLGVDRQPGPVASPLLPDHACQGPATPASTLAPRLWSFRHTWMCFPPALPRRNVAASTLPPPPTCTCTCCGRLECLHTC